MNWDNLKQKIDDAITEQLGAGFDQSHINIEWIDIGMFSDPTVTLTTNEIGEVTLRVVD